MRKFVVISLISLGLILIIMGCIRTGIVMFGHQKVHGGQGGQGVETKISKDGIGIKTTGVNFSAIVIGLVLIIVGILSPGYLGTSGKLNAKQKDIFTTTKLKEGGYRIIEEEVWIDLRKRKAIGIIDSAGGDLSESERQVKKVVKALGDDIEVHFRHATSGPGIILIEKPVEAKWQAIKDDPQKVIYNPFIEHLRGKKIFKKLLSRKGRMTSYYMSFPITEKNGQDIWYKLRYYNAFQGKGFEWAGEEFSADADSYTLHIAFPKNKPFKSYKTYQKEAPTASKILIDNPDVEDTPNKRSITWKIQNAKKGEMYFIEWLW